MTSDSVRDALLPVLDIQRGHVVWAVAGRRASYRPVQPDWAASSAPGDVAAGLRRLGFGDVYLADLDGVEGGSANWPAVAAVMRSGLRVSLDVGVGGAVVAQRRMAAATTQLPGVPQWIVASESLREPRRLADVRAALGPAAMFSLDLRNGQPLTRCKTWRRASPEAIAEHAVAAGFAGLIVLDLAAVGTKRGPAVVPLCRRLHARYPGLRLISGGGVRDRDDVARLIDAGCHRVLVATELYRLPAGATARDVFSVAGRQAVAARGCETGKLGGLG